MVVVLLEARGKGGLVPWASLDSSVVTGVEKYDVDAAACSDFRVKLANIGGAPFFSLLRGGRHGRRCLTAGSMDAL